jgi:hypothetical protein
MLDKDRIKRITDERDPNRCQGAAAGGQCLFVAEPGSQYCMIHGGLGAVRAAERNALRNYQLTVFGTRAGELRGSRAIKDLRDEIAILRMTLEAKINRFENEGEMILQSGALSELVLKIEKLVTACHKLEKDMGVTIDKSQVIAMAEQIVGVISKHVTDKSLVGLIVDDIKQMFKTQGQNAQ